jgi:hypothetical protein
MLAVVLVQLLRPVKMEKKGLEESFVNGDNLSFISLIVSRMHHMKKYIHCRCTMLLLSV